MKQWTGLKIFGIGLVAIAVIALAGCENPQMGPMDPGEPIALNPSPPQAAALAQPFDEGIQYVDFSRELRLSAVASMGDCGPSILDTGTAWMLIADCTTTTSVVLPDAFGLIGNGYKVKGTGAFQGAIVRNAGTSMYVTGVTIEGEGITGCMSGDDRLRGIMFDGAGGSVTNVTVNNINRGASGCQEGNGIEARNAPFDDTGSNPFYVQISGTTVTNYQKTGIVANGTVNVLMEHNTVGESATQENLAANSIQLGFGVMGTVRHNRVSGNQWKGTSDFAASAILVFDAQYVHVHTNQLDGNSDVGLFIVSDGGLYETNDVRDFGADHLNSTYDIGVGDYGLGNEYNHNRVCGFTTPFDPSTVIGKNVTLPDKACS